MICLFCGTPNADAQRYCQHCAAKFDPAPPPSAPAHVPEPVQRASASTRPQPRTARLAEGRVSVLVPGLPGLPACVVAAASQAGLAPAHGRASQPGPIPRDRPLAPQALVWGGAGLVLSAVVFFASHQALRHLPPGLLEWPAPQGILGDAPGAVQPVEPEPAPPPAIPDARSLAAAINAELHRLGVDSVQASMADGGSTTVTGWLASEQDRAAVLEWLRTVPGVGDIDDRLQVEAPPTESAPPPTPPAEPRPPVVQAPPEPTARPAAPSSIDASNRPSTRPALDRPTLPGREPSAPRHEAPARPDAGTILRALQRELARLALTDVTADVDPATLQITLRGTTSDSAGKAQALAAARAAVPGGRVKDLVFLVEQ